MLSIIFMSTMWGFWIALGTVVVVSVVMMMFFLFEGSWGKPYKEEQKSSSNSSENHYKLKRELSPLRKRKAEILPKGSRYRAYRAKKTR